MKFAGAASLRDGVYVLPKSDRSHQVLARQAAEIKAAGGLVHVLTFEASGQQQNTELAAHFDRAAEYGAQIRRLDALKHALGTLHEPQARQRLAAVAREVATIGARDFFPADSRKQMEGALANAEATLNARFAPDEPRPARRRIRQRNRKDYRRRTWATREHLWIDRVASAWLIRRFIDPNAKFLWLRRVKDCPRRAVGFDFDGAEFTHLESKVTFEVLLASFALDGDAGLSRMGSLVHHLDMGGIPTAEGPGFATIMAGARALQPDDDALLKAMTPVLDSLYAGYASASQKE